MHYPLRPNSTCIHTYAHAHPFEYHTKIARSKKEGECAQKISRMASVIHNHLLTHRCKDTHTHAQSRNTYQQPALFLYPKSGFSKRTYTQVCTCMHYQIHALSLTHTHRHTRGTSSHTNVNAQTHMHCHTSKMVTRAHTRTHTHKYRHHNARKNNIELYFDSASCGCCQHPAEPHVHSHLQHFLSDEQGHTDGLR